MNPDQSTKLTLREVQPGVETALDGRSGLRSDVLMSILRFAFVALLGATSIACGGSTPAAQDTEPSPVKAAAEPSAVPAETEKAAPGLAPAPSTDASGSPSASLDRHVLVGGYADRDSSDARVQTAAQKAVALLQEKTKDKSLALAKVTSARLQVVAGTNYQMVLELTGKGGPKKVTVVIYEDLAGTYSLSSVEGL